MMPSNIDADSSRSGSDQPMAQSGRTSPLISGSSDHSPRLRVGSSGQATSGKEMRKSLHKKARSGEDGHG